MIKNLLVSGCSYTENAHWPGLLFSPGGYDVINKAKIGSGNEYIACSIIYHADIKPDFVFVLWSGINRTDMRVPNTEIFSNSVNTYQSVTLGESKFFLSGHAVDPDKGWLRAYHEIKAPAWPEISSIADWLKLPKEIKLECLQHKIYVSTHGGKENAAAWCHQYFLTQHLGIDKEYRSERTWQNMLMCFNLLDLLGVPYRFSFIYDIWNPNEYYAHGVAVKNKYHGMIDWGKYIDLPPYQYGIKHDLLSDDGYHLTPTGMDQWATEISLILKQQKDLQHLF